MLRVRRIARRGAHGVIDAELREQDRCHSCGDSAVAASPTAHARARGVDSRPSLSGYGFHRSRLVNSDIEKSNGA